jgi:O-antigen biosynthesis protein WbqV
MFVEWPQEAVLENALLYTLCTAVAFWIRPTRGMWRYTSTDDLLVVLRNVSVTVLFYLPLSFALTRLEAVPRSLFAIVWFVQIGALSASRIAYRMVVSGRLLRVSRASDARVPVLLVGAGDAASLFLRATQDVPDSPYRVVGLLDESQDKVGYHLQGIEVLGTVQDELAPIVERLSIRGERPTRLVLTEESLRGETVRRLLEQAEAIGITLGRLPRITNLRDADDSDRIEVRPIALEDLLNRPQTRLDHEQMAAFIRGRRVLLTGAGGSIGSELVRQVASFGPSKLILLDHSEFHLYKIDREMGEQFPEVDKVPVIADVRDRAKLNRVFRLYRPDVTFHAAALKHVPMSEYNPCEAVLTNVMGSRNVADACREVGVRTMVMISTDKAVNPMNLMGATKRLAESYCQALDVAGAGREGATRYVTVRFGNVLGSNGSVVPLFKRQLEAGGPITVTHPEIERYFMTIREAVQLVLQAASLPAPRAAGSLFVLDMGKPVRIVDLARQIIRLSGLRPDEDIKIVYTGLRPGEKLFEELFHEKEDLVPTTSEGIRSARPRVVDHVVLSRALERLVGLAGEGRRDDMLDTMYGLVPEYGVNVRERQASQGTA